MSTTSDFDRLARAWLEDGPTILSDFALDTALEEVHLTRQRRALRVPWRFLHMPALTRATGIAAVALVAVVGAGGLIYLNSKAPNGAGGQPTARPTPSQVAQGIATWKVYESQVYGFPLGYPADWSASPATRAWRAGDAFPVDGLPYADVFVSPREGDEQIAAIVWTVPPAKGEEIETADDLMVWAERFCDEVVGLSCETFTQRAVEMNLNNGSGFASALLVPTTDHQYAFVTDCDSCLLVGATNPGVTVVVVARPDDFPPAAPYGGSVELLKSLLTTMDVWTLGQAPEPAGWITRP
jgi:hypothetical protein